MFIHKLTLIMSTTTPRGISLDVLSADPHVECVVRALSSFLSGKLGKGLIKESPL